MSSKTCLNEINTLSLQQIPRTMEIGLYEQIINQLFEVKLEQLDSNKYYVGKKKIDASNVAKYLSRYLYGLFEQVFSQLNQDDATVEKAISLANNIIKNLSRDFYLDDKDLISAKSEILTAVIDKTKCDFPDIAERLKEITPITSLVNSSLFTGSSKQVTMESNHTECVGIYEKMKSFADEVGDNLRKAYNG